MSLALQMLYVSGVVTYSLWWNTILSGHLVVACIRSFLLLTDEEYSYSMCIFCFLLYLFWWTFGWSSALDYWNAATSNKDTKLYVQVFITTLLDIWSKVYFFISLGNSIFLSFLFFFLFLFVEEFLYYFHDDHVVSLSHQRFINVPASSDPVALLFCC